MDWETMTKDVTKLDTKLRLIADTIRESDGATDDPAIGVLDEILNTRKALNRLIGAARDAALDAEKAARDE